MKICISLIPRIMPLFKESELVEILTRLTIHLDDELKMIAFQTLKTFVSEYPQWRKYVFVGFTNFILKEISDMHPKLIENALKMLIQLLSTWKNLLINAKSTALAQARHITDDYCQIIFHLEGFALFNLCHSHIQRRRYALVILRECKLVGELVKCFRFYPYHNYALDILDLASIHAMKQLHLQCFNSGLIMTNAKPDLAYLIEHSASWEACVNTTSYNSNDAGSALNNSGSAAPQTAANVQTQNLSQNANTVSTTSTFYNIINKNARTSSVSNQTTSVANDTASETSEVAAGASMNPNVNSASQNDNDSGRAFKNIISRHFLDYSYSKS